jgi:hypothetical protein
VARKLSKSTARAMAKTRRTHGGGRPPKQTVCRHGHTHETAREAQACRG